ncbi:hypothetical protein AB0M44_36735 [Streptosporangium subroseum]|uniref:hypothetical protein n=1 Tax=Streptosporangium subroseum TaxID=106412 RepID=UPI003418D0B0
MNDQDLTGVVTPRRRHTARSITSALIQIRPTTGAVDGTATSNLSHSAESAGSGAYTVALDGGVTTELTATARSGHGMLHVPGDRQGRLAGHDELGPRDL